MNNSHLGSKALVVFSGGQDSTTLLFWALKNFDGVEAISFDYGQKHKIELECAIRLCREQGVPQKIVDMNFLAQLAPSALTEASIAVADDGGFHNLPSTFVPGRNILFLSMAAAFGVPRGFNDLIIGVCETDYSGYPDCRENFISSMEQALSQGLDTPSLRVHRPLMHKTKAQIFAMAAELGVLDQVIEKSHTCYAGDRKTFNEWGFGCGSCPACKLRHKGFEEYKQLYVARATQGDLSNG